MRRFSIAFIALGASFACSSSSDVEPPVLGKLSTLTARQGGRTGADLVLTLEGTDSSETAYALKVQLTTATGQPVKAFSDWSGLRTNERNVLFDNASAAGLSTFTRQVTLPGLAGAYPNIATVVGSIVNNGGASEPMTASITAQTLMGTGGRCDPLQIASRCGPGYTCTGSPAICGRATAPEITRFAYIEDPGGPYVLAQGSDPADDISTIHVEFLSDTGSPVSIDVTGSGDAKTSIDLTVPVGASRLGTFFSFMQAAPSFNSAVAQLAATPSGTDTGTGPRALATLSPLLLGKTGAPCDLLGFSSCVEGDSCVAQGSGDGGTSASICVPTVSAMDAAAASASTLDPRVAGSIATGYTSTLPLWGEPPAGCLPAGVQGYPQGIVRLHLADKVAALSLTAGNSVTNFPNALFLLNGVGSQAVGEPIACGGGSPSLLKLTNLAAGDYTVVINSRSLAGGQFGITVR